MSATVLIVEDDANIVVSLTHLLEHNGYIVKVASDGEQALEAVEQWRPALVLLDVMLAGKDGFEVCRVIRSTPSLRDTRIVMLTARGGSADVDRGLALGADAYITKPFSNKDLLAQIRRLVPE
jgi:two-component system alkaline phosphatase synthesis response regulator PhoP